MADHVVIEGFRPYDGRYPIDLVGEPFTIREWGWIKRLASYLPTTAGEGFNNSDPELLGVIAVIVLYRAGMITRDDVPAVFDRLADLSHRTTLHWEFDTSLGVDEPEADPTASSPANTSFSGPDSPTNSESLADRPTDSGTLGSAISASAPTTSES